jgi:hypothetical protein
LKFVALNFKLLQVRRPLAGKCALPNTKIGRLGRPSASFTVNFAASSASSGPKLHDQFKLWTKFHNSSTLAIDRYAFNGRIPRRHIRATKLTVYLLVDRLSPTKFEYPETIDSHGRGITFKGHLAGWNSVT